MGRRAANMASPATSARTARPASATGQPRMGGPLAPLADVLLGEHLFDGSFSHVAIDNGAGAPPLEEQVAVTLRRAG